MGRFFTNIQAGVWGFFDSWGEYFSLREQNEKLATENFDLQAQLFKLEQGDTIANPTPRENFSFISACIVTMTTGSQHNYLILDRGAADGIRKDDGVISSRGVVGMVQSVTENFAYAISYANVNMTVSARVGQNGAVGTLRWDGRSTNRGLLTGIPLQCSIEPNDTIYTSGFSTIFPGDIPIGTVISTKSNKGSSCEAAIQLFEDISTLKYVTIVRNTDRDQIQSLIKEDEE